MKIIRITTDLEMTVHDFPEGTHEAQNHVLRELIGNDYVYTDRYVGGMYAKKARLPPVEEH